MLSAAALKDLRERIADLPDRLRVVTRVAKQSGLMWELKLAGIRAAAATLAGGAQNPSNVFRIHAANSPDKLALIWRDKTFTFRELDARMDGIAQGLRRRGLGRGSSVILMMKNRIEFMEVQAGASRVGAAAVSVSWRSTPSELVFLAQDSGAKAIVFDHELWHVVEQAKRSLPAIDSRNLIPVGGTIEGCGRYDDLMAPNGAPFVEEKGIEDDAALVIYTSGTTGKPKGAVRKFAKDALPSAMRFIAETPMRCDDIHLVTCPLYHSTAFGFLALTFVLGGTAVLMDEFKPEPFLELVQRHAVTTTAMVPTMIHRVLSLGKETLAKYDTRSLRVIFSGGAPLSGPLALEAMDQFGDILFNFYGATETGLVTLAQPHDLRAAPGTIGRAVPGNQIKLLDEAGHEVNEGAVGELYACNKMLVSGYHHNEAATKESMRDGFFSVGDLARRDRDGRYFIEGRKRDMVISGGVNVYPAEVESVLESHPAIAEVAVVGVEDPEWGERVRAFIAVRDGMQLDEGQVKAWCRERLAGPKVPRDFVFLPSLPRNPTGKVLKRDLREWGKASPA